jgi:hypothetical protein
VDDPRDFIDPDEGYRDTDWDSSLREPFFTHAVPCENCGEPCEETRPADWNTEISVGPCCAVEPHADLTPQQEALDIARLSAWQLYEAQFLRMLQEAGCTDKEAEFCMTAEVS